MQSLFKAAVLLLLAAVTTMALVAQSLPLNRDPGQRPAGCHQHTAPVPAPGPTSHNCCEAGHSSAIVQQGSSERPPLQGATKLVFMPDSVVTTKSANSPNLLIVCSDPHANSPLRV
jgi:hypothetical protein